MMEIWCFGVSLPCRFGTFWSVVTHVLPNSPTSGIKAVIRLGADIDFEWKQFWLSKWS
jgi:hypothetical protein